MKLHLNRAWRRKHGFDSIYTRPDWHPPILREVKTGELPVGCRGWIARMR